MRPAGPVPPERMRGYLMLLGRCWGDMKGPPMSLEQGAARA